MCQILTTRLPWGFLFLVFCRGAARYLDKAGNRAEVVYARGVIEVYKENYKAAVPYFEEASKLGIAEAAPAIEAIKNHWRVSSKK